MSVMTSARPSETPSVLRHVARWWLLAALVLVFAGFAVMRPQMADGTNIVTVLRSASFLGIMVLGLTFVAAGGKIDVSFMQIAALANMTAATLVVGGAGWGVAGVAGVAVGTVVGAVNGLLVGPCRLPPLIVTIATGGICGSAAAAMGKGTSVRIDDAGALGRFLTATLGPVPLVALLTAALFLVAWYVQDRLTFGRYVYAIEKNEEAVREVGVPTARLVIILYALSGLTASVAGVLLAAGLQSGQPMIGNSFFIDGLIAVLLGGMIRLGRPNIGGTAITVLLLACLVSGGALMGWADWQVGIIKGALLLLGVTVAVRMGRSGLRIARGGH